MAEPESVADMRVPVLLPLPFPGPFDYRVDGQPPPAGALVRVPLGPRVVSGVVWDGEADGSVAPERLKTVLGRHDAPPIPGSCRRFIDWVARYTVSQPGPVLRMAISVPAALDPPAPTLAYRLAGLSPPDGFRVTPARKRVLDAAADLPPLTVADLAREAAVGPAVVKGLVSAGLLEPVEIPATRAPPDPDPDVAGPMLSAAQRTAAQSVAQAVRARTFSVHLLDGVTGSGKTEVYFEAIAEALRSGGQVLVLLPEIALTGEWLARFEARFGAPPMVWHSDLTAARRRDTWRAVAEGGARVLVGARSALFLPFPALSLLVVDEEHEPAFKQEDGVPYHARDMAVARARLEDRPILLASATPSLETLANVATGRYRTHALPRRHGGAELPRIEAIDMRVDGPARGRWIAPALWDAVTETLGRGEQALLFLNRRGYAPLTLCRACGHRLACPNCASWLVLHRLRGRLQCHHCGYSARPPDTCPECGAEEALTPCGPGVERLAEEVEAMMPEARRIVLSSDTLTGPAMAERLIQEIREGRHDLLIGTQVLAKGHNLPKLTLVGVIDADLGLGGGDLRAAERTYQLLHQVAGRAGRADKPGRALLQTYAPEHPVMRALLAGDRDGFVARELARREETRMPPFGRLVALILSARQESDVDEAAARLARAAPRLADVRVLGPAPAPLALLRGRHRRRFLISAPRSVDLQAVTVAWLEAAKPARSVRVTVDVDPYSFL